MAPESRSVEGTIRVALVDDHPLFRAGVAQRLVTDDPGLVVVAECGTVREALESVPAASPDIVLMDIGLPDGNGIDATRGLLRAVPGLAVIILSIYDDIQYVEAALEAGASGYFLKTVSGPELAAAVRRAHDGDAVISPELAAAVFRRVSRQAGKSRPSLPVVPLSIRERQVLRSLAAGRANKEIAREMDLSVRTVEAHLRSIYGKLLVGSRTEAVITAIKEGVVDVDSPANTSTATPALDHPTAPKHTGSEVLGGPRPGAGPGRRPPSPGSAP